MRVKISNMAFKAKPKRYDLIMENLKNNAPVEISLKELALKIGQGHSFILANFKESAKGISLNEIENTCCIGLDIDSKENEKGKKSISRKEFINIVYEALGIKPVISYCTFSDDGSEKKFRVIYLLENPVNSEEYKQLYKAFIEIFKEYLDEQTSNINRCWNGTNKRVQYNLNGEKLIITDELKENIMEHLPSYSEEQLKNFKVKNNNPLKFENEILNQLYIKGDYKNEICDLINKEINIAEFIKDKFGGYFKDKGGYLQGTCSIHNGDNKGALVIYKNTNTCNCFTHCGAMNVVSLCKKFYKTNDFSSIVFRLINEYNLGIPKAAIGKRRGF